MNGWAADILDIIDASQDERNIYGLKIFNVKSIKPLILSYDNIDIGASEGDTIYVHPLFVSDVINLDENSLTEIQNFTSSSAYNSPEFSAIVKGSIPDFIKDFYLFYKNWLSEFVLSAGDLVAVWELGDNAYLILQKIAKYVIPDKNSTQEDKEV